MMRPLALALLAAVLFGAWGRSQDTPAKTYTIGGVVVNPGNVPAKRVRVSIAPSEDPEREVAVTTGDDGLFRFDGVKAGKYALHAETLTGDRHVFGVTPDMGFGIAIVAGEGQHTDGLVFRLLPRAALHGRVIDQGGDPVEGATVQLLCSSIVAGRRRVYHYSYGYTDDRGEYRFAGLAPGTWYLVASGRPWYAQTLESEPPSALSRMGYPAVFYPGSRDPRGAAPLHLQAGQDLAADFTLIATPGGTLDIAIKGAASESVTVLLSFEGVGGTRFIERVQTGRSEARFNGVPPGTYRVRAKAGDVGHASYAEETVLVGAGESKVELAMEEGPTASGVVTFDGLPAVPAGTLIGLRELKSGQTFLQEVTGEGRFRLGPLPRGSYQLAVMDASVRRLRTRRLLVDGAPAKSHLVEISKAVRLEVSATRGGGVSGYVYRKEIGVPGALVVLAPRTDSPNPADYEAFQTDSDGSFEFLYVSAGDYIAFVVEDPTDFEYSNPEAVRPRLASGQPVRIEDGKSQSIRLELQ